MNAFVVPKNTCVVAVEAAEKDFDTTLAPNESFMIVSNTNAWILQGAAPLAAASTVSAATGAQYLPANVPMYLSGSNGAKVSIIRDTADGKAVLSRIQV